MLFGRPSTLPSALKKPPEPQYNYDDYVSELKSRLQTVHHHAHRNLIASKVKSKGHYDKTPGEMKWQVGDKVQLFDETVSRGIPRKLSAQWIGSYTITEIDKVNPYPTAFPYGNGMVLHFYQQRESSTTKTVHKAINKRLKTYV